MARAQAKTNNSNKSSSKKPEAPPPAATPITNVAPVAQAAPAKKETPAVQAAPAPTRSRPSAEQISRRAYELFLARGGEHGHHDEDWVQAERELQLGR
ncbi:hypothetical protein CYFUS_007332 [Cystobacter fuscus]|uniref:DUF2934 domain-containing protein n=1 Tax=Cystobacter fuscus TaxID=43 RepID=A0A250JFC3_9BACT|nr:DUF2934 domain-containing protein [Cystobacter fuscus]ATB41856.1 hypothetical protein CYFUS_007332 [Cystobacter fuscus]